MIDAWVVWLLLVCVVVAGVGGWLLAVRLPREDDEITAGERRGEARWISNTIESNGGVAPHSLVEEVLELHEAYRRSGQGPRVPAPPIGPSSAASAVPAEGPARQSPSQPGGQPYVAPPGGGAAGHSVPPGVPPPPPGYRGAPPPRPPSQT